MTPRFSEEWLAARQGRAGSPTAAVSPLAPLPLRAPFRVAFDVPLAAIAKGRPRGSVVHGNRVAMRTPERTARFEATLAALAAPFAPPAPLVGPLEVALVFSLARPKRPAGPWPTKKPDVDNCVKSVLDGIGDSGQWWRDDAQVVELRATKRWAAAGAAPTVTVRVREIEETAP